MQLESNYRGTGNVNSWDSRNISFLLLHLCFGKSSSHGVGSPNPVNLLQRNLLPGFFPMDCARIVIEHILFGEGIFFLFATYAIHITTVNAMAFVCLFVYYL